MERSRVLVDLQRAAALPTLPVVAVELMGLTLDDSASIEKLARLISTDQALTLKVFKVANSPFYRRERRITTLPDAILLLGRKFLRSLVLSITVFDLFDSGEAPSGLNPPQLWVHSLAVAQCAKVLGAHLGAPNPEDCFVAGLLHDIGQLVLAHLYPEPYGEVLHRARELPCDLLAAENEVLSLDHATVGKWALERWQLPPQFVEAAWLHHCCFPGGVEVGSGAWLAGVVALSNGLCNSEGYTAHEGVPTAQLDVTTLRNLGVGEVELVRIADEVAAELPKLTATLHLPAPSRKTYLSYLQRSNLELGNLSLELQQKMAALESRNNELLSIASLSAELHATSEIDELAKILVAAVLGGLEVEHVCCTIALGQQTVLRAEVSQTSEHEPQPTVSILTQGDRGTQVYADSTAHVELVANGKTVGFISVRRKQEAPPRQEFASSLITFANIGALAIEQALTRHQLQDRTEELVATSRRLARAEGRLAAAQHQATRLERLKVLGELTASVLHDFKNSLSVLLGRAQLFLLECTDEKLRRHAEIIEKIVLDASQMLSQLSTYGKESAEEAKVRLDLNAVAEEVVTLFESRLKKLRLQGVTIEVVKELQPLPPILAVASYLREALTNLLLNAIEAMPRGGRFTLSSRQEGEEVVLVLADTGVGMSPETLDRVGKLFYTTKGDAGTGIGISVTKSLVSRLNGSLSIASTEDVGTTITLRFRAAVEAVPQQEGKRTETLRHPRPAKILLLERDEQMRDLMEELLVQQGHEVVALPKGPEEIEAQEPAGYDLVISEQGGDTEKLFKLAHSIKTLAPECRFLLVANGQPLPNLTPSAGSAIDYVVRKPFRIEKFLDAVALLLLAKQPRA
ncbi:MAG: HDOD domain-containing protein [Candidatus Tectomicrobia bacterium]|nr:HDOD domain-containing protein [Candidatus Tectomicrobia bacterium]